MFRRKQSDQEIYREGDVAENHFAVSMRFLVTPEIIPRGWVNPISDWLPD